MNIVICGGGNVGHVIAGFIASHGEHNVAMLTTHPEKWSSIIEVRDCEGKIYSGNLSKITSVPGEIIPDADIIFVCVPGFAIHDVISNIYSFIKPKTWVGTAVSSTGFFFEAFKMLSDKQPLFGYQRVPFISRIIEYGHLAELKGYKESLNIAVENAEDSELVRKTLEELFQTPTQLLDSYCDVILSNSNPLLHTARLYSMWKDWKPGVGYSNNYQFYSEWTIEASELLIKMDVEFQQLLLKMGVKEGRIPTILSYYESHDALSLTKKLCSITAFKGIMSPVIINREGLYEPDLSSRYFTEDIPFGMRFIIEMAKKYDVNVPHIKKVYIWGRSVIEENN